MPQAAGMMRAFRPPGTRVFVYGALVLGLLVAFLLPGMLEMGWSWDDRQALFENPAIRDGQFLRLFGEDYWAQRGGSGMYRPIAALSLALDLSMFGADPAALHRSSLLLHLLACVALACFFHDLRSGSWPLAFLLLYLHPCAAGQAIWVSGRSGALMFAFVGFALLATRRGRVWLGALLLLAASLCREDAIVLVALLPWLRLGEGRAHWAAGVTALAAFVLLRLLVLGSVSGGHGDLGGLVRPESWVGATRRFGHSIRQLLLLEEPRLFSDSVPSSGVFDALLPICVLVGAWMLLRRKAGALGLCWLLLAFLPLAGLTGLGQGVTGRYAYALLPALLCLLLASAIFARVRMRTLWALAALPLLLLPFAFRAAHLYASEAASYQRILADEPESRRARLLLALAYENFGDLESAIDTHRELVRRHSRYSKAHVNLGRLLWQTGKKAEARVVLEEAVRRFPGSARAALTLGRLLYASEDWLGAADAFAKALRAEPREAQAARYLVRCSLRLGHVGEARAYLERARELAPAAPALPGLEKAVRSRER